MNLTFGTYTSKYNQRLYESMIRPLQGTLKGHILGEEIQLKAVPSHNLTYGTYPRRGDLYTPSVRILSEETHI